jgi:hypothetical protein
MARKSKIPVSLSIYEHDEHDDLIERFADLLMQLGYDMTEVDVDDEDDEIDLYARFSVEPSQD